MLKNLAVLKTKMAVNLEMSKNPLRTLVIIEMLINFYNGAKFTNKLLEQNADKFPSVTWKHT